ncbi:MAG: 5'/3'-nucleotidase SurE [Bacteroidota bacterium]|nr:5'/3'-nucleotidase SurE [Bacteroidota bacterium]
MKERLILISNDDGPHALGLHALIEVAKEFGRVVVVVSDTGQSGKSHSITMNQPLRIREVENTEKYAFYTVSGTPVDSIKLGLDQVLSETPDVVLAGINHGSNAAVSVIYSGTMGVALEAALHGIPAIGFSLLNFRSDADFTLSKVVVRSVLQSVLNNGLAPNIALNVNIPDISPKDFKGIQVCRQALGVWSGEFEKRIDPIGRDYFWMTGFFENHETGNQDTDEYALSQNMASVVPVKPDFTDYASIEMIKKWNFEQ